MRERLSAIFGVLAGVLALAVLVTAIWWFLAPRGSSPSGTSDPDEPAPRWAAGAGSVPRAMNPGDGTPLTWLPDPVWLDETAAATGIPRRALAAYAGASIVKEDHRPECRLDWTTLAGVGATESGHGSHGGAQIAENGDVAPQIFGPDLDGNGVALIEDSDGGEIDGDAAGDRAVGPMQMIPQSWRNWHVDGNGDGVRDPHNMDDAVMAAANYLCRASSAFDTEDGWRAGVLAYNGIQVYAETVARFATRYADAVRPTPTPTEDATPRTEE